MAGDPKAAFRTYANYLEAWHTVLAVANTGKWSFVTFPEILAGVKSSIVSTQHFTRVQPVKAPLDWGTELLLVMTPKLTDDYDL